MTRITIKKIYNKSFGKSVYVISKDNRALYWANTKKEAESIVSRMKK